MGILEQLDSQDLKVVLASLDKLEEREPLVTLEVRELLEVKVPLDRKAMQVALVRRVKTDNRDKLV